MRSSTVQRHPPSFSVPCFNCFKTTTYPAYHVWLTRAYLTSCNMRKNLYEIGPLLNCPSIKTFNLKSESFILWETILELDRISEISAETL